MKLRGRDNIKFITQRIAMTKFRNVEEANLLSGSKVEVIN